MKRFYAVVAIIMVLSPLMQAQKTEKRNLSGFTEVSMGIPGELYVKIGSPFSVELSGNSDEIDNIETEVSSGKLVIRRENNRFLTNSKVTVNITMPSIEGLSVSGSGKAEIQDAVAGADDLYLSVSGSGSILAGKIEADNISCTISGSGNIRISGAGSSDSGKITISGSGSYSGGSLEIDRLNVTVSGSGNCLCNAGDELTALVSGSGNIIYRGDPRIDARVSGSGKVRSE
ncbi:MAG TPA: head GIN domain-containing protein [Bacteroidales bacterium]|nr:head GIN domain-containing protein [Bacteroidales bacterium]